MSTTRIRAAQIIEDTLSDRDGDTKVQVEESADEDKIRFDTAGAERAIITDTGSVGIGTSAPIAKLDVAGKIAISVESSTPTQPADGKGFIYTKTDGKLYWRSFDLGEVDLTAGGGGGSGINNIVEDTSPQLGGTLDANSNTIDMGTNIINDTKVGQWDIAYGWGNHASAGYLTSVATDSINDTHIDFGTGANQVSTDDLPEGSSKLYYNNSRADARADIRIGASSIDALSDVETSSGNSPTDGQVLTWDNSNSYWKPTTVSSGGSGDITAVISGTGLSGGASSGDATINLDINSLTVDSNNGNLADSIAIVDADDSNNLKKITLTQLKTLVDTNTVRVVGVDTDGNGSTDNTLESSETLVLKAGTNVTLAESSGIVTINSSGGSGGISFDGSTANGVLTYKDSDEATVESSLTFDGSTLSVSGDVEVAEYIKHAGDNDTFIQFADDSIGITAGGEQLITISEAGQDIVTVGDGGDVDFRVRTENDDNTLYIEGSTDRIGIGTNSPSSILHIKEASPTLTFQRENNSNASTINFLGHSGNTANSIVHDSSTNDLVFKTFNGSTVEEIMRIGDHYGSPNRQVTFLSGSTMHAGAMQPRSTADISFFVSGSIGSKGTTDRGTSVFGGDLVVSGSIYDASGNNIVRTIGVDIDGNGSTDSTLESSEALILKAGTNVTLAESAGVVTINSSGGGGGSGDITSVVAGSGLSGGATTGDATVNLDVNDLTAVTPTLSDSIAIADADDSDNTKKSTLNQIKELFDTGTQELSAVSVGNTTFSGGSITMSGGSTLANTIPATGTTITINDGLGTDFSEVVLELMASDNVLTTKTNSVPINVTSVTGASSDNSRIIFNLNSDHIDQTTLSNNKWHTHWSTSGSETMHIHLFDQDGNSIYFIPVQGNAATSNFKAQGMNNVETNSFGRIRFDSVSTNSDGTKSSYYSFGIVANQGDEGEKILYNLAVAIVDAINKGNINFGAVHILQDSSSGNTDLGALTNSNFLGTGIGSGLFAWMAVNALMIISNDAESTGHPIGMKIHRPTSKNWSTLSAPPLKIFYGLHTGIDPDSSSEASLPTNTDVFYTQRAKYGKENGDTSLDNDEMAIVIARIINNLPMKMTAQASGTSVNLTPTHAGAALSTSDSSTFTLTSFSGGGTVDIEDGSVSVTTSTGNPSKIELFCESSQHKVTIQASTHNNFAAGDVNFTLPTSNGTSGQALVSDGNGNTSWATRIQSLIEDAAPQLGANLDTRGYNIVSSSGANIGILPDGSGKINLDGNGSTSGITVSDGLIEMRSGNSNPAKIELYCEVNNAHKVTLAAPPHAQYSGNVNFQLPPSNGTSGQFLKTDGSGNTTWDTPSGGGSVRTVSVDENGNGSVDETLGSGETLVLKAGTNVTLAEASGVVTINSTGGSGGISVSSPSPGNSIYYNGSSWLASPSPTLYYDIDASTGNYKFTGPGVNNSTNHPTLYLYKGFTYVFDNTGNGSHPIEIRTSDGGSAYTDGVSGSQTGVQVFTVPHHISDTSLVYQCTSHSSMVGNLTIV